MSWRLRERFNKIASLPLTSFILILVGFIMIGVTAARIRRSSTPPAQLVDTNNFARSAREQALKFRSLGSFDGTRESGTRFSNEVYKSSECSTVIKGVDVFDSPRIAEAELERQSKQAEKVLERGPKVELALRPDPGHKQYAILWIENSELHSISADSIQDAREFENWLSVDKQPLDSKTAAEVLTFTPGAETRGTKDGVRFFEQQFKSIPCVTLTSRIEYLDTSTAAEELLQKRIKSAVQVIEQGSKTDAARGERVVVLAPDRTDDKQDQFIVMWTEDSQLHSVEAPILNYVLAFEKQHSGPNAAR
jgi:hypothetical protein